MVRFVTLAQLVASLLYTASLDVSVPSYYRFVLARRHLMIALRGVG